MLQSLCLEFTQQWAFILVLSHKSNAVEKEDDTIQIAICIEASSFIMVRGSHKSQLSGHSFLLPSEKELSWYFPFSSWIAQPQSQEEAVADPKVNQK